MAATKSMTALTIAQRAAKRDLETARDILLRLHHDWRTMDQGVEGMGDALLTRLDDYADAIERLTLGEAE